jgi:hypothetical protein
MNDRPHPIPLLDRIDALLDALAQERSDATQKVAVLNNSISNLVNLRETIAKSL